MEPTTAPVDLHVTWGGPQQLSAWDAIMWRAEGDPRTTSIGMLVELLDSEPEWTRFLAAHRRTVMRIPRLRERVVEPPLPVVQPVWSPDPHFELRNHVRRLDLGGNGTRAELLALCESLWTESLDRRRAPWEATLVTGLQDGRAAYVFKCHHSLTDGMGLVQLLDLAHSDTAEPSGELPDGDPEFRPSMTSAGLLAQGARDRLADLPSVTRTTVGAARRALTAPRKSADEAIRYGRSLARLLGGDLPARSPLLANTGAQNRLLVLDLLLDDLKAAGRAAGGSVNDAYVAAVLGGLRKYHERYDVHVERIPVAMPVSLRSPDDPAGGNRFAGVRFAAPLAEADPAKRIALIGAFVRDVRHEPAISYLDRASTALSKLPDAAIIEFTARATAASDMQISNIPGLRRPAFLAGARVLATYPLGPRPGVALMVTMLTYEGKCCVGLNVDGNVFPRLDVLEQCLEEGFGEVLALAGTEVPR